MENAMKPACCWNPIDFSTLQAQLPADCFIISPVAGIIFVHRNITLRMTVRWLGCRATAIP